MEEAVNATAKFVRDLKWQLAENKVVKNPEISEADINKYLRDGKRQYTEFKRSKHGTNRPLIIDYDSKEPRTGTTHEILKVGRENGWLRELETNAAANLAKALFSEAREASEAELLAKVSRQIFQEHRLELATDIAENAEDHDARDSLTKNMRRFLRTEDLIIFC